MRDTKKQSAGGRAGGRREARKYFAVSVDVNAKESVQIKVKKRTRTYASGKRATFWRAQWIDPDTGQHVERSLKDLTTHEARQAWAEKQAEDLARRKRRLGSRKPGRTALEDAVADFLDNPNLRPKTLKLYAASLKHFTTWAGVEGVGYMQALTPGHLARLRKYIGRLNIREPMRNPKGARPEKGKGVGRGANERAPRTLSPASVHQHLRCLRTFLKEASDEDLTPGLTSDDIRGRLKFPKRDNPLPHFLRPDEIAALLGACDRHDAETFDLTRAELDGDGEAGTTPRYDPIRPFVLLLLLTGMRFSEGAGLKWSAVDFRGGKLSLGPEDTKTKSGREIELERVIDAGAEQLRLPLCPSLVALLKAMKLASSSEYVFGKNAENGKTSKGAPLSRDKAEAARRRLIKKYGAPVFTWHDLRRTCGTYLTCSPGIFGGASAAMSAKRLGHSVVVAERKYVGRIHIHPRATSLEQAMGIEPIPQPEDSAQPRKVGT